VLTLSLLLALPVQDDAKVTLDLPIAPLPVVLKQIEAQTGFAYQVTGPNRNQQIFIKVKDMPSAKLREAIAKVTDSNWTLAGSTWALITKNEVTVKDAAFRKSLSAWFAKQKAVTPLNRAALEEALKKSEQLAKQAESDGKKMMELYAMGRQLPKNRLASRIILSLGLNEVLSLADKERRVYAFNPTVLQKALPGSAGGALAEYRREQADYLNSVSRLYPAQLAGDDENFNNWNPLIDPYRHGGAVAPAAAMMFALKRNRGTVNYELLLYDAKGNRVETEGGALSSEGEDLMAGMDVEQGFHKQLQDLTMPVNLSEEDKIFAKDLKENLFGGMMMMGNEKKNPVSEITKQRLLNMDKVDPLTYGPTQMLQQFADVKKKNVVAKVTDLAIFSVSFGIDMEKPATLASAVSLALGAYGGGFEGYEESDDMITLRPTQSEMVPFPIEMNRPATAQFLRSVVSGVDPLEAVSNLAVRADNAEDIQLPILLSMLFGSETMMFFAEQGFDLVKLYGQLNPAQKEVVKNNGLALPLSTMTGPMAQHVRQMLLSGESFNGMSAPAAAEAAAAPDEQTIEAMMQGSGSHYNDEITVKLANLPAGSGRLLMTLKGKQELFMKTGGSMFMGNQVATPSAVAFTMLQSEQNPNEQFMKLSGFVNGLQRTLSAQFAFGEAIVQTRTIEIPLIEKNGRVMKLTDLSADFQKQVKELMETYRKDMQTLPMGGGGGGASKPPAR
jgi:hypothetical protein